MESIQGQYQHFGAWPSESPPSAFAFVFIPAIPQDSVVNSG
jgi:hypothetical protein